MSWDKGFDFRATSGFVTDPTNCTWVLADAYPTTRNGVTFGWVDSIAGNSRDRDNTVNARLAGINFVSGSAARFQVDLPSAADYIITTAMGDATASFNEDLIVYKDNTTQITNLGPVPTSAGHFLDTHGNTWTSAAWPGSNVTLTFTYTTTTAIFLLGGGGDTCPLAHLFLSQVSVPLNVSVFN